MKLYFDNLNKISEDKITQFIIDKKKRHLFFTDDGIYNLNNNKLFKIKIIDNNVIEGFYNQKFKYYIDNSEMKITENDTYILPINHISIIITTIKYKFCDKDIYFIIEKYNDINKNFYFLINQDIHHYNEDINSFLSIINFYKFI